MTDDKFFNRATNLHLMIGFLDQSGDMSPDLQWAIGNHFELIYLLLEEADKAPRDRWTSIVGRGFAEIDNINLSDVEWRLKLDGIISSAGERSGHLAANSPEWIAHGLVENLASLRLLIFDARHQGQEIGFIEKIYRVAEEWILEDISPPDLLPRKNKP